MGDELEQGDSRAEGQLADPIDATQSEELDDAVIKRGFQSFALLAALLLVVAIVVLNDGSEATHDRATLQTVAKSETTLSSKIQRSTRFPRVSDASDLSVSMLVEDEDIASTIGARETLAFSGGMSLMAGIDSTLEIITVSHWPEGRVRRWELSVQGLTERAFGSVTGELVQGWISVASVDVDGDGLEDIVTGGLGMMGCWLRDASTGTFLWQNDACGLVVDGDAWVSSIEVLDGNADGQSDLWLNLMTKRLDGWLGKPNALWLSDGDTFRQGGNSYFRSEPPSRASYASSLIDLDGDGVSEILVSNLDGPMEIWRQISGQPYVESREFFSVGQSSQSEGAALTGELDGDLIVVFLTSGAPLAYAYTEQALGVPIPDTFKALDLGATSLRQMRWWDYDLDGRKDLLIVAEGCVSTTEIRDCRSRLLFRNEEMVDGGIYALSTPSFEYDNSSGLHLLWDLDGDGDEDFVVMGTDGAMRLRRNSTDLGHQWIGLSFDRRWVGAELVVVTSDGHSHREVLQNSSGSRVNQGLWRRFGLKDANFVNRIKLKHPLQGTKELMGAQGINTWIHFE